MKNKYRHNDDGTTIIYLQNDLHTVISTSDFDKVNSFEGTWSANKVPRGYRVQCELWGRKGKTNRKVIFLHRWILEPSEDMQVDHINMDQLDNRRENIRIVTRQQNAENKQSYKNSSTGVRGVCWDKTRSKYLVSVRKNNKQYNFGRYDTLEEAEKVAIEARKQLFTHSEG